MPRALPVGDEGPLRWSRSLRMRRRWRPRLKRLAIREWQATPPDRRSIVRTAVAKSPRTTEPEEFDLFRKDVGSFIRVYDFLSQIVNYADTDLEKRSLFLRLLARRLTGRTGAEVIDFSAVELTHIKQTRSGDQTLGLATGDTVQIKPVSATGSGTARDPRMVLLAEVLAKINDLFPGEDFTPAEQQS